MDQVSALSALIAWKSGFGSKSVQTLWNSRFNTKSARNHGKYQDLALKLHEILWN